MSAKETTMVALRTCDELKIDPREARVKLRAATKARELDHKSRGAWAWEPSKVAGVKAIIAAPTEEPKAKTKTKAKAKPAAKAKKPTAKKK